MDLKHVVVVDDDIDVFDPTEVEWAIATRVQGDRDVMIVGECARQAARSQPAAGLRRGADRRQGRHRRDHSRGHPARALRAHHLCVCGHAPRSTTTSAARRTRPDEAGDPRAVEALAAKILQAIDKEPLYYTDIAERFAAYDFRTIARALGHLHATEKLWQDPRGRMCVRGSKFAAKPPVK